jgi:hypothetical protein
MAILFSIKSDGGPGLRADIAKILVLIGCCTGGVAGTLYEADPGQDLTPTLGYGPVAIADARMSIFAPNAQRYALKVAASTAGTISAVTQSGAGPLITVAGSTMDAITTPFGEYKVKVKVLIGGLLSSGAVRVAVALDGASYNYEFDVPPEAPGTVISTVDLNTLTLPGDLDTKTVVLDPGAVTVTLAAPATVAAAVAQVHAAAGFNADLVQGKYLRIRSDAVGASASVEVDATSTADDELGLDNLVHQGSASTVTIPGTGLVITFPTGTYVKDEVYSFTTTAPRASLAAITSAITAAITANPLASFMHFVPVQAPLDDVDLRAYADGLDVICAANEAAEDKRFLRYFLGAPLGTTDSADKAAMLTHVSRYGTVATRDCFLTAPTSQPQGRLRVSAVEQAAIRRAAAPSFSEDLGNGEYGALECTIVGADNTLARNEATASIKLGGSQGPGFAALTLKNGRAYFKRGVTRAGSGTRFVDEGVATATSALAAVLFAELRSKENKTYELNANGTIAEFEAAALETAFEEVVNAQFVRGEHKHFSRVVVTVDREEVMSNSRQLKIAWKAQIRGQGEHIDGTLTVGGTITESAE